MSEDKTKNMNNSRSFEERVFARFDTVDERFQRIEGNLEIRIRKLESRQYDTKPIWEQVLVALAEINTRLDKMDARFDGIDARLDKMDARFDKQDTVLDNGFRSVERKMDVLNKYFLETRADQRYLDDRLEKLESQSKPS